MNWARVGLVLVLSVAATSVLAVDENKLSASESMSCGNFNNALVASQTKGDSLDLSDFYTYADSYLTVSVSNVGLAKTFTFEGSSGPGAIKG